MAFAPALSLVASSEVSAGSPALQQLVDDIRSTCKNMNQGGDTWKDCEKKQGKLALFAGCSKQMFGPKDSSGKRSFEKSKLDECQKKINDKKEVPRRAQEMLDFITGKCTDVDDVRGVWQGGIASTLLDKSSIWDLETSWANCEGMQNELTTIGCSGEMFEKTGDSIVRKKWSYIKSETDACQEIINQIKTSPDTKPGEGADVTESGSTAGDDIPCRGGPMGWIMCPLIEIMSELIQSLAALIDNMMQYRLLAMDGSQNALLNVWRSFLNIANVLLVLAFLAIIYSQATSMGLSNYGIKRMLPRLVLVAIAMNISFYVCAFAVDLSNIAGNSIMGIFSGLASDVGDSFDYSGEGAVQRAFEDRSGPNGLQMAFGALLVAGVAAVVLLAGGLVPVVLGLLIVFCSLVGRQVVITVLTVISPLAFAAWLLPNTEQYFKKWWQVYSQMLFAYPMVMAVFGGAIFVAGLIQEVNQVQSNVDGAEIGGPGVVSAIIPLIVLAIPLFFIPKIIMSTNSIMGKIGGAANSIGKKLGGDALDKRIKEGRQNTIKRAGMGLANNSWADKDGTRGRLGRAGRWAGGSGARRRSRKANLEENMKRAEEDYLAEHLSTKEGVDPLVAARAAETKAKRSKEEVSAHETLIGSLHKSKYGDKKIDALEKEVKKAAEAGDMSRMKAAQNLLMQEGSPGVERIRNISADPGLGDTAHQALSANLNANHRTTIEEKDPELLNYLNTNGVEGAKSDGAYDKLTPEGVGKLTDKAFERALRSGDTKVDQQILAAASSDAALSKMGAARQEAVKRRASELGGGSP